MEGMAQRVFETMFSNDAFSQWLGIRCLKIDKGYCLLSLQVRKEMTNGFGIAHGGISYSLADSALAFAANSHGQRSLSVDTSINHLEPVLAGDVLQAEAREINRTSRTGLYEVRIMNQEQRLVAWFKGTVYRTSKEWFNEEKQS